MRMSTNWAVALAPGGEPRYILATTLIVFELAYEASFEKVGVMHGLFTRPRGETLLPLLHSTAMSKHGISVLEIHVE